MSAEPCDVPGTADPYEVIHLGGQAAVVVPLADFMRLRAYEIKGDVVPVLHAGRRA